MKKDVKALIKRLTLLIQFTKAGKGWIAVDGDGQCYHFTKPPVFSPSGESESFDRWVSEFNDKTRKVSSLDSLPLSMVCPSLPASKALFYTDGETVWLIDL